MQVIKKVIFSKEKGLLIFRCYILFLQTYSQSIFRYKRVFLQKNIELKTKKKRKIFIRAYSICVFKDRIGFRLGLGSHLALVLK